MFKKKKRPGKGMSVMKRSANGSDEDEDGGVDKEGLVKAVIGKRQKSHPGTISMDGTVKQVAAEEVAKASQIESTREALPMEFGGGATAYDESNTDISVDARALLEKQIALNEEGKTGDGIYRGQAGYQQHIAKDQSQVSGNKVSGTQGPIRAPTFARKICHFDYQPDICKDYKETGFCGFGDSCKFLHDRGDYKQGWQQEQEWKALEKKKMERAALGKWASEEDGREDERDELTDDDDVKEDFPHACFICRDGFTDPVVTLCGHYYCASCASDRYKEDTKCAACGKQTGGVFNRAVKLEAYMTKKIKNTGSGKVVTEKSDSIDSAEEDYEIKDELKTTGAKVTLKRQGDWSTVS